MQSSEPNIILMTADSVGGVWTYALELCREFGRRRISVHLAIPGRLSRSQKRAVADLSNVVKYESEFALEWMEDPWEEVDASGEWLLELAAQIRPDLVHLNSYSHGSLPWKVPSLVVAHSCVLSWWKAVKREVPPGRWDTYTSRVREGLLHADSVVAVSGYMLDELNHFYGPLPDARVIYNARDDSRFEATRKERMIFSMGRVWDEAKNISSLREISGQLPWPVCIAGDGGEGHENSTSDNVTSLGILSEDDVAAWLGRAAIYVHPARYEPFGLSVLEAAHSGCALVLADIPSLREVWGDAALYADPYDSGELVARILELTENPVLLGEKAREAQWHGRNYLPRRFGEGYIKQYKKLLKQEAKKLKLIG